MTFRIVAAAAALALAVGGCATERRTQPSHTATEQLLMTRAVDRVMDRLHPALPEGTKVWVDAEGFKEFAERYMIGAIEDRMLRSGANLVGQREQADVVVEARVGALSIDEEKSLIGIPAYDVPIPFTATPLTLPEVALYSRDERRGTAKIAVTAYDAKGGAVRHLEEPIYGFARKTEWTAMLFFSWTTNDLIPEHVKRREEGVLGSGFDLGPEPPARSESRPDVPRQRPDESSPQSPLPF